MREEVRDVAAPTPSVDRHADPPETLVQLVDKDGRTTGTAGKMAVHQRPPRLHRGVSIFLLDADRRLIFQRRSARKYHSAHLWANTCCGHPFPGESALECATRRLGEELGVTAATGIYESGQLVYRSWDPASGLAEHEYDHLFVGWMAGRPEPDPDEVAELRYIALEDSLAEVKAWPNAAGWLVPTLRATMPALIDLGTLR